jgi:hypothetical protein
MYTCVCAVNGVCTCAHMCGWVEAMTKEVCLVGMEGARVYRYVYMGWRVGVSRSARDRGRVQAGKAGRLRQCALAKACLRKDLTAGRSSPDLDYGRRVWKRATATPETDWCELIIILRRRSRYYLPKR